MSEDSYLYRIDRFDALRRQRYSDPILRGRRLTGEEASYPHHQIRNANKDLAKGLGVFRLSFWKSWEAMRHHLWDRHRGVLIQRVSKDHPVLAHAFFRDHDEYLKHDAWLFWTRMPINAQNPNWSPLGIPHTDIEIFNPDGSWMPFSDVDGLNNAPQQGWSVCSCSFAEQTFPIHFASRTLVCGKRLTLLRKPIGPWPNTASTLQNATQQIVQRLFPNGIRTEDTNVRWFLAQEESNRVHAEEFNVCFSSPKANLFSHLRTKFGTCVRQKWSVTINDETRPLSNTETAMLYEEFGIQAALSYESNWNYSAWLPAHHQRLLAC